MWWCLHRWIASVLMPIPQVRQPGNFLPRVCNIPDTMTDYKKEIHCLS
jgi:hypothetical protein